MQLKKYARIETAVLLVAGKGSRLITKYSPILPKPLIPVNDTPVIDYVMKNILKLGLNRVIVIVNYKEEIIRDYLEVTYPNLNKIYVRQEKLTGIADGIKLAEPYINGSFFVFLGDEINIFSNHSDFLTIFAKKNALIVQGFVEENNLEVLKRTNEVKVNGNNLIIDIEEKPNHPEYHHRAVGIYLFDHRIFSYIEKTEISSTRNEREITDTVGLVSKLKQAYGIELKGFSYNINTNSDLEHAKEKLTMLPNE